VPLIREKLQAGDDERAKAGIEYYRQAGQLLIEAREQITNRNEWFGWLKRNFKDDKGRQLSERTASRYMQLAEAIGQSRVASRRLIKEFPTLSSFIEPDRDTNHRTMWIESVKESVDKVNVERLIQERQDKEKEEQLIKGLALRLIDIGYRALAGKLHPDRGGSAEAMARLNKARDILKAAV
jgi:hypothetical protein